MAAHTYNHSTQAGGSGREQSQLCSRFKARNQIQAFGFSSKHLSHDALGFVFYTLQKLQHGAM